MVSHEQRTSACREVIGWLFILAFVSSPAFGQANARKFYPDDPLLREPTPHPIKDVAQRHVDDMFDFLDNSFPMPRRIRRSARGQGRPALDTNTLGDVPDSPWYTNRHFYSRMSIEELKRGPGNSTPPDPHGPWRVISAKSNGVTPGFVIEDRRNNRYLIKFDRPEYPELASAADVIGSKAFHALGYSTPENYIVHFRSDSLHIASRTMWRDATGKKRPLTERVLDQMLKAQPKGPDGTYRALASRWISGQLIGPFSYEGMRTDDPNDIIPHEHRRALRGLRVFAAWLNHQDTRSINSMDSVVQENGSRYVKHFLMDFGSILGSDGADIKPAWAGHQYVIENKHMAVQMVTFGFYVPRWARSNYARLPGVGLFDGWSFDPTTWKPTYPNPAFLLMDSEDAYWAAKQVASFSDAEIRALVETGEYSDPRATDWMTRCLIERRDKIATAWLSKVLPLDKFSVAEGKLTFVDLGKNGEYSIRWSSARRDGLITPLPDGSGAQVPALRNDSAYLLATIEPAGARESSGPSIVVYLRVGRAGMQVVGVDRHSTQATRQRS